LVFNTLFLFFTHFVFFRFLSSSFSSCLISVSLSHLVSVSLSCLVSSHLISSHLISFFSMSTPLNDDDPELDFEDVEEDACHHSQSLVLKKASSITSTLPPSSISSPSGLAVDTIARLTHDELCHNAEFMKYVRMVDALQELLSLQEKASNGEFCLRLSFFRHSYLLFFSACDHCQFNGCQLRVFVPAPE
jgi:hypothetical protein